MEIVVFEGRKGGGMSLSAVAFAYREYLKGKKPICSTVELTQKLKAFIEGGD